MGAIALQKSNSKSTRGAIERAARQAMTASSELLDRAGGTVPQPLDAFSPPLPERVKRHQKLANSVDYMRTATAAGIAFRPSGLFPPDDPLLHQLAAVPALQPFEKHLSGGEPNHAPQLARARLKLALKIQPCGSRPCIGCAF